MLAGAPTLPVATKVTAAPGNAAVVAVSRFSPTVPPSVQLPTVAVPEASVVAVAPVSDPPPSVTAKVTVTPGTPAPVDVATFTLGFVSTAEPAMAPTVVAVTAVRALGTGASGPDGESDEQATRSALASASVRERLCILV
jgi:hypothetical protein